MSKKTQSPKIIKTILPKVVDVDTSGSVINNDLVYPSKMVEESMMWCIDNIPGFEEMSTLNRLEILTDSINKKDLAVKELNHKKLDVQFESQQLKAERKIILEKEKHKREAQQPLDRNILFYNKKHKKHKTKKREPLGTKNGARRKDGYDLYEKATQKFYNPDDILESKKPQTENQELGLYLELKKRIETKNYKNFFTESQSIKLKVLIECRYDFNKASKELGLKPNTLEKFLNEVVKSPKVSGLKEILSS